MVLSSRKTGDIIKSTKGRVFSMKDEKQKLKISLMLIVAVVAVVGFARPGVTQDDSRTPIRIGWQTSWATQGQLAVTLQKTNILSLHGLEGRFAGFSYGGPLNEGALAGEVDVIFTADQPACMLLARGAKWKIVGRLMYSRVGTVVPPLSSIQSVKDLKGGTVGIPFGAAAQRETLKALLEAGLDVEKDVTIKNIGIYEEMNVIQSGTASTWGDFNAFATWDPPFASLEYDKKARTIHQSIVTSVIVMSEEFIAKHPDAAADFLSAFVMAYAYYAQHPSQANQWFKTESKLDFADGVLDLAASVEPNLKATGIEDVSIALSETDLLHIQAAADFIFKQGMTDVHLTDMSLSVDGSVMEHMQRKNAAERKGLELVEIVS